MFERFADRAPYSVFDTQALHDYCQHGLKPAEDGQGFELACAPISRAASTRRRGTTPASTPASARCASGAGAARPAAGPERQALGRAGHATWPALAQEFHRGRDLQLMDKTHMLPMEDPALTARLIANAIAG